MAPHPPHEQPSRFTLAKAQAPWRSATTSAPPTLHTSGGALLRSTGIKRKVEQQHNQPGATRPGEQQHPGGHQQIQPGEHQRTEHQQVLHEQQAERQQQVQTGEQLQPGQQQGEQQHVGVSQPTPGELAFQVLAEIAEEEGLPVQPAQPKKRPFIPAPGDISRVAGTGFSKAAMASQRRIAVQLSPSPFQQRQPPSGWVYSTPPPPAPLARTNGAGIDWEDI